MAALQIDDRKSPEPQGNRSGEVIAFVIGTPVRDGLRHRLHEPRRNRLPAIKREFSANSAHNQAPTDWRIISILSPCHRGVLTAGPVCRRSTSDLSGVEGESCRISGIRTSPRWT